jgi:ferredoxin
VRRGYTAPATSVEDARSGKARLKSSQTTAAHRENYDPRRGSGLVSIDSMNTRIQVQPRAPRPAVARALALIADEPAGTTATSALLERAVAQGLLAPQKLEPFAFSTLEDCDKCDGSGRAGFDFSLCVRCGGCGIDYCASALPADIATFLALCAAPAAVAAAEAAARELYLRYVGVEPAWMRWHGSTAEHGLRLATQYRIPAWPRSLAAAPYDRWTALSDDFAATLRALEASAAPPPREHSEQLTAVARSGLWIASVDVGLVLFVPTDGLR